MDLWFQHLSIMVKINIYWPCNCQSCAIPVPWEIRIGSFIIENNDRFCTTLKCINSKAFKIVVPRTIWLFHYDNLGNCSIVKRLWSNRYHRFRNFYLCVYTIGKAILKCPRADFLQTLWQLKYRILGRAFRPHRFYTAEARKRIFTDSRHSNTVDIVRNRNSKLFAAVLTQPCLFDSLNFSSIKL